MRTRGTLLSLHNTRSQTCSSAPSFPQGCPSTSAPPGSQRLRWGGSFSSLPIPKTQQLSLSSFTSLPPTGTFSPLRFLQRPPYSEGQMNVGIIEGAGKTFPFLFRPHCPLSVFAEINLNLSREVKNFVIQNTVYTVTKEQQENSEITLCKTIFLSQTVHLVLSELKVKTEEVGFC